jgi:predicted ribosome quality control (RQC) complex YloA/Tae2 family protein
MVGRMVESVSIAPFDRVIFLHFKNYPGKFVIERFGLKTNFYLLDEKNVILESFKKSKIFAGKVYEMKMETQKLNPLLHSFLEWLSFYERHRNKPIKKVLTDTIQFLNSTLANEILYRAQIEASTINLNYEILRHIWQETIHVFNELQKCRPIVYVSSEIPQIFSIIELKSLETCEKNEFQDINEALKFFVLNKKKIETAEDVKNRILKAIDKKIELNKKTIFILENELKEARESEKFKIMGQLIIANIKEIKKGEKLIEVKNIFENDLSSIEIELDSKLTPHQNAEIYFDKAKKLSLKVKFLPERIKVLEEENKNFEKIIEQTQTTEEIKILKKIEKDLNKKGIVSKREQTSKKESTEDEYRSKYREFVSSEGWKILVGKDGQSNDILTFKVANKNDLWLHAQGVSGSHVVVRKAGKKENPGKTTLREAASLAAYYSKAKTSSVVPVIYTLCKYVRKHKGSPAGTVTIEREKTIFVEPKIPVLLKEGQVR